MLGPHLWEPVVPVLIMLMRLSARSFVVKTASLTNKMEASIYSGEMEN